MSAPLDWHTVLAFSLLAWLTSATPGPAVLLSLRNGASQGFGAAAWSTLGNQIGLLVLASASTLGLGVVLHHSLWLFTAIKWAGALYLVYLGVRMWRSTRGFGMDDSGSKAGEGQAQGRVSLLRTGIAVALTNPKALICLGALFPQFIDPLRPTLPQMLALVGLMVLASSSCLLGYGWMASRARRWLQAPQTGLWINRGAGGVFVLFGLVLTTLRRPA